MHIVVSRILMLSHGSVHVLTTYKLLVLLRSARLHQTIGIEVLHVSFGFAVAVLNAVLACFSLRTLPLQLLGETLPVFHVVHGHWSVACFTLLNRLMVVRFRVMLVRTCHGHPALVALSILTPHRVLVCLCFGASAVSSYARLALEATGLFRRLA